MAINSKTSLGKRFAYIQSRKDDKKDLNKPGQSSLKSNPTTSNVTDAIKISAGDTFYESYKNETLETALIQSGISQLRPEIIGSFEFAPPYEYTGTGTSWEDDWKRATGSGELIDMQSQLKQIRCQETLYFLYNVYGLIYDEKGVTQLSETEYEGFRTWEKNKIKESELYTQLYGSTSYNEYSSRAKEYIDFLETALSLYLYEDATDIKLIQYRAGTPSPLDFSISSKLGVLFGKYGTAFIHNMVPGKMSLKPYLVDYLGYPEGYWKSVSNTALMMHLVGSVVGRCVYPFTNSSNYYKSTPDYLKGFKVNDTDPIWSMARSLKFLSDKTGPNSSATDDERYFASYITDGPGSSTHHEKVDTETVRSDRFTQGRYWEIWDATANDPRLMYIVARDYMNSCAIIGYQGAGVPGDGTPGESSTAGKFLKEILGWNPLIDNDSFASIDDAGSTAKFSTGLGSRRLGLALIPPTPGESDSIVASFNRGSGDSPSGVKSVVPGSEYYVRSFFQNGGDIDTSIDRLGVLASDLDSLRNSLWSFVQTMFYPDFTDDETSAKQGPGRVAASNDSIFRMTKADDPYRNGPHIAKYYTTQCAGVHGTARGDIYAAHFPQLVIQETAHVMRQIYTLYTSNESVGDSLGNLADTVVYNLERQHSIAWLALQAAAANSDCAWQGFKYIVARDMYRRGRLSTSKYESWCEYFARHIASYYEMTKAWTNAATGGYQQYPYVYKCAGVYDGDAKNKMNLSFKPLEGYGPDDPETWTETNEPHRYSCDYAGRTFWIPGYSTAPGHGPDPHSFGTSDMNYTEHSQAGQTWEWGAKNKGTYSERVVDIKNWLSGVTDYYAKYDAQFVGLEDTPLIVNTIWDAPLDATQQYEYDVAKAHGVTYTSGKSSHHTKILEIGRLGRLLMAYQLFIRTVQPVMSTVVFRHTIAFGSGPSFIFKINARGVKSLFRAAKLLLEPMPDRTAELAKPRYDNKTQRSGWQLGESSHDGHRATIENLLSLFDSQIMNYHEYDVLALNSLYFINQIIVLINSQIESIIANFNDNSIQGSGLTEALDGILSDPDLGSAALASVSKEQVILARVLRGQLMVSNRVYPYLPRSKASMPSMTKNLATFMQATNMVHFATSGRKRIFACGLTSGLMEFLRRAAATDREDARYRAANIVKLSLWKRNLVDETVHTYSQDFYFDVSKFITYGQRSNSAGHMGEYRDTADSFTIGQSLEDLLSRVQVTKYSPAGVVRVYNGQAFTDWTKDNYSESSSVSSMINDMDIQSPIFGSPMVNTIPGVDSSKPITKLLRAVFEAHTVDHYLKQYLKLTQGIDLQEDVFCLNQDKAAITGPDENAETLYSSVIERLALAFPERDMASALTFQRVKGELARSILFSPQKYRNRVILPKIFDRVFCILVDDRHWNTSPSDEEGVLLDASGDPLYENALGTHVKVETKDNLNYPVYDQYYFTVSIVTPLPESESELAKMMQGISI